MNKPRKITHDIPENKIEYCDEIGADSETDTENSFPTEVYNLALTILNISKRSCYKNYQESRFYVIIATEILSITGV